ncbi:AAA family ATPase [Nocardia sp. NPDC059091]|uniref:helix-turn-helix transcriptional regulator n=1 Tax=unclassified Nocardia TaxID=2637762 RepID=UPI00369D0C8C
MPVDGHALIGRAPQLAVLRSLLDELPAAGGACTIVGAPGIGKTALLDAMAGEAATAGLEVLRTAGVEVEAGLPFAGLHQLVRGLLPAVQRLPAPQRAALLTAFGIHDGPRPETFMVALATLNLLTDGDTARVAIVDDMHWLDGPSQEVLAFVARRISKDPLVILASLRTGYSGPYAGARTPELEVPGLDDTHSRVLLARHAGAIGQAAQARIRREAGGNPLALVELPLAWRDHDGAGAQARSPEFLPLTAKLERAFAGRVAEMPAATRAAMLIAAIDYADALPEILSATSLLIGDDVRVDVFDPAIDARLLHVDGMRVRLHHPLVRSAVLQSVPPAQRMAANAALAEALVDEPYRRTWHRAQSIVGPDDDVADELEASHAIALRRGGVTAAIWALERAAQLCTASPTRGRRLLLAAEYAFGLGQVDLVDRLLRGAAGTELSELDHARMEWIREIFSDGTPGDAARVEQLCEVARRSAAAGDLDLALNLLLGAALRCWWADTGPRARALVVTVAEEQSIAVGDPRWAAIVAVAEPVRCGTLVHERLGGPITGTADADALRMLGMAAHAIGDSPRAIDLLSRADTLLRAEGRLGLLSHTLAMQPGDLLWTGDWKRAAEVIAEGRQVAEETRQPIWINGATIGDAMLCGLRGELDRALALVAFAEESVSPGGLNNLLSFLQLARGLAWLCADHFQVAFDLLRKLFDPSEPCYHQRESFDGVMFFAEAAVHADRVDEARRTIAELEATAAVTPSPLLHIQLAYARAVLADDAMAEALYRGALGRDLARWPLVRAKTELAYGNWLRRRRRVAEARALLRSAQTTLDLIGATTWARRARAELRAAGERDTPADSATPEVLSPQEAQIARLAAQGLSNRQIAERLYLSPRTVGSHLYRIFPKLGITSRNQLGSSFGVESHDGEFDENPVAAANG